jgi:N-methylhydantoinase A
MLAYGGNGPVFAAIQAQDLGIRRVLVPKASPAFSALGTLVANISIDEERSYIASANKLELSKLKELWGELSKRADKYFADSHFLPEQVVAKYQMKMRYPGQNWSLTFDFQTAKGERDMSFVNEGLGERAIKAFNERHTQEYGHVREGETPEVVGVRLATYVESPKPAVKGGFSAHAVPAAAVKKRRANLGEGYQDTDIFHGPDLRPGNQLTGPAIIEEVFTTIVVYPGWKARMDDAGDYELTRQQT